jgi:chemotaxis protein MotB
MSGQKDERAEEIIIVRRRYEDGDHHHGGVWKIAFADFMTALMAFFLVMWLINAANTETKASVASYFNPVKLTDSVSRKKGLLDLDERSNAEDGGRKSSPTPSETKGMDDNVKDLRAKDKGTAKQPVDKLAVGGAGKADGRHQISSAEHTTVPAAKSAQADPVGSSAAREAGRVFRDPFAPFTGPRQELSSEVSGQSGNAPAERATQPAWEGGGMTETAARGASAAETAGAVSEKRIAEAGMVLQKVRTEIQRLGISGGPGVEVTVELDDLVISVTDTATFGMFAVGSAEPNEQMGRLMQALTPILSTHGDRIVVRGHTDARPFRGDGRNNNWRLAMARAEAAYGMLLRSGIDEMRFERIEAHADRKLKTNADPQAAANRRIEILLRRSTR